jgi:hypothetical protein
MYASGAISMAATPWRAAAGRRDHVLQRVVQRAQVGVDLLLQVAGQEAQVLARLHRRARQDDALDPLRKSASTAIATARYVLPVPAGPIPTTMSFASIASR